MVAARPDLGRRLRLHFLGTGNRTGPGVPPRVLPEAEALGVAAMVREIPERIDYLPALAALARATGILLLGSSERHYTASKIYPALLARRPLLALFHEASVASATLRAAGRPPSIRLVTYGDSRRAEATIDEVARELAGLLEDPLHRDADLDPAVLATLGADRMAGILAGLLDRVVAGGPGRP